MVKQEQQSRGFRLHFETLGGGAGPYRSRHGMVFGVCRGIAEHFDISLFWLRALLVIAFFVTGMWMVGIAYVVAALMMKVEPALPLESPDDEEFYNSYATSRALALRRLKRTYDNLDRRIQRIEARVTDKEYDWDQRLNQK